VTDDYREFIPMIRIRQWRQRAGPDLLEEAIGHAVGLREYLYGQTNDAEAQDRILALVDVLTALGNVPS
jgi:hypothetical protein